MLSTASGSPKGEKVTDDYSICHRRPHVFPKSCYHELKASTQKMTNLSLQRVECTERNIFMNRNFLISHQNTGLLVENVCFLSSYPTVKENK